jgi:hypothetical protein
MPYKTKYYRPRVAKVIALWGGRRQWQENPHKIFNEHNLELLKCLIKHEKTIDNKHKMDLFLVNSTPWNLNPDYVDYLNKINGDSTKNGKIIVLHRKNFGLSLGAFDYAFQKHANEYDYWFFTEDDYINVAEDFVVGAINQINNSNTGFVAAKKMCVTKITRYARGGTGMTSTSILKRVLGLGLNKDSNGTPHLPFHRAETYVRSGVNGAAKNFYKAERNFTNVIYKFLKLRLTSPKMKGIQLQRSTCTSINIYEFMAYFYPNLVKKHFGNELNEKRKQTKAEVGEFINWLRK